MHKHSGFTLIEILVGLSVMAVLSTVGTFNLISFRASRGLRANMEETESVILGARDRSRTQEEGYSWGVRFSNTGGSGTYELFSGASYAPENVSRLYRLSSGVRFSSPNEGGQLDLLFAPRSGEPSEAKIISMFHPGIRSLLGDIILSSFGNVGTRIRKEIFGYWHFDEAGGATLFDASPAGHPATLREGASRSSFSCKAGTCLYLDGTDDYASGNFSGSFSRFTVSGWAHLTGSRNSGSMFSAYFGGGGVLYGRFLASSRKISFFTLPSDGSADELTSETKIPLNEWHHLAYVYDGSFKRIYLDGQEIGSRLLSGAVFSFDNFEIGRSEKMSGKVFEGYLDVVRFYGRALSADEIMEEYNELR